MLLPSSRTSYGSPRSKHIQKAHSAARQQTWSQICIAVNIPLQESDRTMHQDESGRQLHLAETQPPTIFTTSVTPTTRGDWMTVVNLDHGITLSKLFDCEDAARRYGDELAAWLRQDQAGSHSA